MDQQAIQIMQMVMAQLNNLKMMIDNQVGQLVQVLQQQIQIAASQPAVPVTPQQPIPVPSELQSPPGIPPGTPPTGI